MSRSGSTISVGMLLGLPREPAARFSFLLGIPAIGAAATKEGLKVLRAGCGCPRRGPVCDRHADVGSVGYLTIRFFLRYLTSHSLNVFAWYRLALAAVTVVWLLR